MPSAAAVISRTWALKSHRPSKSPLMATSVREGPVDGERHRGCWHGVALCLGRTRPPLRLPWASYGVATINVLFLLFSHLLRSSLGDEGPDQAENRRSRADRCGRMAASSEASKYTRLGVNISRIQQPPSIWISDHDCSLGL